MKYDNKLVQLLRMIHIGQYFRRKVHQQEKENPTCGEVFRYNILYSTIFSNGVSTNFC
jgi:hypothetical protein